MEGRGGWGICALWTREQARPSQVTRTDTLNETPLIQAAPFQASRKNVTNILDKKRSTTRQHADNLRPEKNNNSYEAKLSQSLPLGCGLLGPYAFTESLEASLRTAGCLHSGGCYNTACTALWTGPRNLTRSRGSSPSLTAGLEKRHGFASSPFLPFAHGLGL